MKTTLVFLQVLTAHAARFQDLALGTSNGPLSLIFLDHLTKPRNTLDLETAASIVRQGFRPFKTGKLAAVIKNTRVEIQPGTKVETEMVPQLDGDGGKDRVETGKTYRVDGFDFTIINAPYLPELPAVCKLINAEWGEMKKAILQRDDVADADVILPDRMDLHNQPVSSPEARECIEAVLTDFLRKFDLSQKLTRRSIWDPAKLPNGGLVSVDLCAGESVFSIHSKLAHSLPFNPYEERETALYAVVLPWKNAISDHGRYSNFVAARISPAMAYHRSFEDRGVEVVYTYSYAMDDIRQNALHRTLHRCESSATDSVFPYCQVLSTELGAYAYGGFNELESSRGVPNVEGIERVRKMGTAFLNRLEERAEGRRR